MRRVFACGSIAVGLLLVGQSLASADGADVILGELIGPRVYGRYNGIAAITVGTTSCNAGNQVLQWKRLPDNKHPVITLNMYRLLDGRMTQIGQSWAKHGFVALQQNVCNFGCQANPPDGLGVGCSDPYGASNNQGPGLGSRRLINPMTGEYDGGRANSELNLFSPATPIDHGLQVKEIDLVVNGARYFLEGHYIAPDDASAGNNNNNTSHLEVRVTQDGSGNFVIENASPTTRTVREVPAVRAWPYADFSVHDGAPQDGRLIVAHRVIRLSRLVFRYEYAIYNMNSDRGLRSFSVPVGSAQVANIGFSGVFSHGEAWSNDPWQSSVENGRLIWSTLPFQQNENANAIRWGTTYNFWFESQAAPAANDADLGYFKPGPGPEAVSVKIQAPRN